jgi:hypothetical protein
MSCRIPVLLAGWLIGLSALAAPPRPPAPARGAPSSGVLSIRLRWNASAPLPAGDLIACRARVVPVSPSGVRQQGVEASVQMPGSGEQCALEIPLGWQGSATPVAAEIRYEMDLVNAAGRAARIGSQTIEIPRNAGARLQLTIGM